VSCRPAREWQRAVSRHAEARCQLLDGRAWYVWAQHSGLLSLGKSTSPGSHPGHILRRRARLQPGLRHVLGRLAGHRQLLVRFGLAVGSAWQVLRIGAAEDHPDHVGLHRASGFSGPLLDLFAFLRGYPAHEASTARCRSVCVVCRHGRHPTMVLLTRL